MSMFVPNEATALVNELAEPVPRSLRDKFFARVGALLGDEISPARIIAVCQKVQNELLIAPAVDEKPAPRPPPVP